VQTKRGKLNKNLISYAFPIKFKIYKTYLGVVKKKVLREREKNSITRYEVLIYVVTRMES